ncbi:GtrA family protein [Ralstonia soli]|uniref:GtrA family protein n=1 Tax=Ralstonia soli TaxID=2953896 RepID=A0ABT1AGG3_9RALS|nr:GtrA family protein [Ralstonia soli]MCO5397484.1 GtrA family protein [Ralstonia soli]
MDASATRLAAIYIGLAVIAISANIGAQDLFLRVYAGAYETLLSVAAGTGVGLVVKYLLDKRFIFDFQADNAAHDARVFMLYTVMGLATTAIFWAFEFGFGHVFGNRAMRYVGGVLGLALGYYTKYQLDKRFVFRRSWSQQPVRMGEGK